MLTCLIIPVDPYDDDCSDGMAVSLFRIWLRNAHMFVDVGLECMLRSHVFLGDLGDGFGL